MLKAATLGLAMVRKMHSFTQRERERESEMGRVGGEREGVMLY